MHSVLSGVVCLHVMNNYLTFSFFSNKKFICNFVDVLFVHQVPKEVSPAAGVASQTDRISKAVKEICSLQTDDGNVTKLDSENLLEEVKDSHQIILSDANTGALRKRRRKTSPASRPKEDEHTMGTGDSYSHEGSPVYNVEKKDLDLMSDRGHSSMLSNSLRKKKDSFSEPSLAKNGQSHKKKSMVNQHKDLEFTSTLKGKILKMKERSHDAPKKTGKRIIAGSSKMRVEKKGGVIGDTSKEEKHQLSPQVLSVRKEIISHVYVQKDAA